MAALRRAGTTVFTATVRPCPPEDLRSEQMRSDAATTSVLLGSPAADWLRAHAGMLLTDPAAWAAGLRTALGTGAARPRNRVWQVFYFGEAVLLLSRLRRLGASGPRHVHVHFANNGADVARLAVTVGNAARRESRRGWSWSFSMHGPTEFEDPVGYDLAAKTRSAAFAACISAFARDQLRALAPDQPADKFPIVRMGVDVERFPGSAQEREQRTDGPLRVLFVGRLVPEKAPDVVLRAVAAVAGPVEVVLVGQGPLREKLDALVAELGLGDRVRLVGAVGQDELPAWYRWADVFCLPSHAEGVPVVLMEAMATELPVVTTRIAGIPELVADGHSGVLVEPGDPVAVTAALDGLAADPVRRRTLGAAARRTVVDQFTPAPNARRIAALFDGVRASR